MVRKQVYLERRQDRDLKRLAKESGRTEAEIIREAIERLVDLIQSQSDRAKAWQEQRDFIRRWIARGPAPSTGRTWKRQDLYDRPRLGRHEPAGL